MNITHMSVSRKGVWDECQWRYRYKYHLEIPSPAEEPYYFTYGKIVHKIAEEYVRNKTKMKLAQIAGDVLQGRILLEREDKTGTKPPPLPIDYREKLPSHLRSVQQITDKLGCEGLLEHPFYYDLDGQGRHVKGFIDRLIPMKQNHFFILDYKTSKKNSFRKNAGNITKDLQLRMYARVVQKEFNVPPENIYASLYYLEGGDLISARFSEQSLIEAETEMLEAYKQIQETPADSASHRIGNHCTRCDYRSICPFVRSKEAYTDVSCVSPYILG
jgi:RecB family exonuclease